MFTENPIIKISVRVVSSVINVIGDLLNSIIFCLALMIRGVIHKVKAIKINDMGSKDSEFDIDRGVNDVGKREYIKATIIMVMLIIALCHVCIRSKNIIGIIIFSIC